MSDKKSKGNKYSRFDNLSLTEEQKSYFRDIDSNIYNEVIADYFRKYIPWRRGRITHKRIYEEIHALREEALKKKLEELKNQAELDYYGHIDDDYESDTDSLLQKADGKYVTVYDLNPMSDGGIDYIFNHKFHVKYDRHTQTLVLMAPELNDKALYLTVINHIFIMHLTIIDRTTDKTTDTNNTSKEYTKIIFISHLGEYATTIAHLLRLVFTDISFNIAVEFDSLQLYKSEYFDSEMEQYENLYHCLYALTRKKNSFYQNRYIFETEYENKSNAK